ncbi:MAG TPA: carboxypeptidase regulatory-like domain-containing protein, partial [Chitinophagales bacterium]|nr:carboxypeptidase regulatory-like domain-containing protein [Chitinophagales bacterium]
CLSVIDTGCAATVCHDVVIGPPGVPVHYITGAVTTGTDTACSAVIYLISDSAGFLSLAAVTHTVDSLGMCDGFYYFPNIPQGNYYVKAALDSVDPDYANYLPTYYGNELNWGDATLLALTSHTHVNINLVAGVNPGGPGFVGGWVFEGAGLAIGGDYNESRGAGDPIAGIQINLLTQNDIPVASAFTNASGRYTFSNLALGTYKIYAEQINKVPYAMNVTLDANNQSQDNVNVLVNSNSAVTGVDDMLDISITGVYPNPVTDKTSVTVTMKQSTKVTMTLTDVNGRTIHSRNMELATGTNDIKLDMNGEAAGVYHMNLTSGNDKKIIRLVKVN